MTSRRPRWRLGRGLGLAAAAVALAAAALAAILGGETVEAVPGCCSGHGGVCDCACCDGTPLSETCRSRMPRCAGRVALPSHRTVSFSGRVVAVKDGDTIEVLHEGRAVRVRVAGVDCPEKEQPFGARARRLTSDLTFGKTVEVRVETTDRYGRTVAEVRLEGGRSLAHELLRAGLAWWYSDYSKDETLRALEREAREARRGLWSDPDPIPPWVFRRRDRM